MGQEKEAIKRKKAFKDFQINKYLMDKAAADVLVMHCLPAHRGEEITDEAIEHPRSIVFDQAENRLHIQKAILVTLMRR
jgi:ornithine carbamoyltransferase